MNKPEELVKFNNSLLDLPQVKSLSEHYNKTKEEIVQELQPKISIAYSDGSIKRISIQFLDQKTQTLIHSVSTF